jgi:hypothetical protein
MREICRFLIAALAASAVLAFWLSAAAVSAQDELEEDHELSTEFVTPHTDWAQPYALGKTRVLYFGWGSYGKGIAARDIVELMQRFDIEAKAAYYHRLIDSPQTEWRGGQEGVQRILRLLDERWDCFIFAGIAVTLLPEEAQYKMYKAVTEGAGLVLIGVDDERGLKPRNKLTDVPPFLAAEPVGDAYRVKAGRGVRMPERPQIEYQPGWSAAYDYWLERVGRAVLWAANKAPRANLAVTLNPEIERARASGQSAVVAVTGADTVQPLDFEARLRAGDGSVVPLRPERRGRGGETSFSIPIGRRLPAGGYHLDIVARSKRGVEAWATLPFEVTAPRTVTAVELDKAWGEVGDKVAGAVTFSSTPTSGETALVQLRDAQGRILAQANPAVAGSTARFEFPLHDWMPMLLEVRGVLVDGEGEVSSAYSYFKVTKRSRGRFNFVVWDYPRDPIAPYIEQQLARLGCAVQLASGPPPLVLAASNMAQVPYTTRIMTSWDSNGYMLPTCWNNEPAVDEWVDGIVKACQASREHGVFVYSLGDEVATTGSCVHPACLAAYRRYLEQEYSDIAALNASWGTSYARFDEVQLSAPNDNDEAGALRAKQYPRWCDRQAFKGYNLVKLCERFGRRFEQLDPRALTGFEGAGGLADGTDIDLVCRTNGFWSPYPGPQDEVLRSIVSPDFIHSNWMGYSKDADSLLGVYWRMVTRGDNGVWWWQWDGFGTYRGLLRPDLSPWKAIKEMQRDTQIVRDGLGDLLMRSRREDDGIAILYSYPSSFATKLEAGPSYGKFEDTHIAWQRTLRALGLQFSYVTDRMLRQGEFRARRFKILILPRAEAIGPREAEVIRQFVTGGGTVIADVRPGIYDGHCKPLARGALDDLFGIQRSGEQEAAKAVAAIRGALEGKSIDVSLSDVLADPAVRPEGGQALGAAASTPACVVNEVGKGRAALLNFALTAFPDISNPAAPQPVAAFAAALLASGGVEPVVAVTNATGRPVRDTEVIRWKGHGVDFLTIFGGKNETVRVTLPQARHVYDLRERAYRGYQTTFTVHKLPTRATFVALSPVPLSGAVVKPSVARVERGGQLAVRLSCDDGPIDRGLRVSVYDPQGAHAEWFDQVLVVGREGAEIMLPIALNDAVGRWTIRATDLFTNETAQAAFEVR